MKKRTLIAFGIALLAIQFVPAPNKKGPVPASHVHMAEMISPRVGAILDRSCQDCHSANTRWPWYSRVAPVSWFVARDVQRGRAKLDFSTWAGRYHSANELMEICDAVSNGSMPIGVYTLIHRNARLSSQDVDRICDWAGSPDAGTSASKSAGTRTSAAASLVVTHNTQQGAE